MLLHILWKLMCFILKERHLFEIEIVCNIINVTFDQCNASLLKKIKNYSTNLGTIFFVTMWYYNVILVLTIYGYCKPFNDIPFIARFDLRWLPMKGQNWSYPWCKALLLCRSHAPSDLLQLLLTDSCASSCADTAEVSFRKSSSIRYRI